MAQRNFGEPSDPIYLLAKASAVGEGLQLSIAKKGPNGYGVQERVRLSFGGGEPLELFQLRYGIDRTQIRTVNLTKEQKAELARVSELRWENANFNYLLALGAMRHLLKVVEECRAGLAEYWNGTEEKKSLLKQEARLDKPVRWLFSDSDYPDQAVSADQSGTAKVVGLVDEKGHLRDCMVVETSGVAVLDAQTCIMMHKRGRFTPAIGPDNRPVKSVFVQLVRWEMP